MESEELKNEVIEQGTLKKKKSVLRRIFSIIAWVFFTPVQLVLL
jgi:hypothetical protein